MKIESIETFHTGDQFAIVRVRTDDGAEGYGQTSPYLAELSVSVLHRMVAPWFIGQNPWDIEALVDGFIRDQYKFYGTLLFRALCGVDTAIWDLLGKVSGQPVYRLLGGAARREVPVYGSSMLRTITPEAEAERMLGLVEGSGFTAFKIRIGEVMGQDADAWPGRTEAIIPTVRERLGDSVALHADANGGYSVSKAIRVGRMLEEHGYSHYEEPCPFPQLENTAQVAAALDIAVAGGEQDNSLEQFQRMISTHAVDIVQPDIGYIGGMARAAQVARMAQVAGIPCTPHCANQSMLQLFTLHLAAAMPAVSQWQEWSIEDIPWTRGVFGPVPEVVNGVVTIADEPGWGVSIDDGFLRAAERAVTRA